MTSRKEEKSGLVRPVVTSAIAAAIASELASGGDMRRVALVAGAAGIEKFFNASADAVNGSIFSDGVAYYCGLIKGMFGTLPDHAETNAAPPSEADLSEWLTERLSTGASAAIVRDHVRRLQEAVEPEVIPTLGRLAAYYIRQGRSGDANFRALSRIIADLSAEEHAELILIFSRARISLEQMNPGYALDLEYHPTQSRLYVGPLDPAAEPAEPSRELTFDGFESFERLRALFETNGLDERGRHSRGTIDNDVNFEFVTVRGSAALILSRVAAESAEESAAPST